MMLDWFNGREAAEIGTALADGFSPPQAAASAPTDALPELLRRADRDVRTLQLNFYKKARFANSFKWRLIENGVERRTADEVTRSLILYLSKDQAAATQDQDAPAAPADQPPSMNARQLLAEGNKCIAQGAFAEAITYYQDSLTLNPRNADALNNLGAALCKVGRYGDAEKCFRQAVAIEPGFADAHSNLGNVLRWRGRAVEAESWLRRALTLNPKHAGARTNLGLTLAFLGRIRDAKAHFEKALKVAPRNAEALFGKAYIAALEGRFDEAGALFKRVLDVNPKMPGAWAGMASIRKMTTADADWLEGAEQIGASGLAPIEEADVRFAVGKYYDDVGQFEQAFQNYQRANELLKTIAETYDRDARTRLVDDLIRVYTPETLSKIQDGASASMKPVFVVGMMRSGTSLVEQIIASHPAAKGAGELGFWSDAADEHQTLMRQELLGEATRKKLAEAYLRVLEIRSGDAARVVDKAPVNADYLGVIHSVFPNARIIYMRRDPIDTCLSCYFQNFSAGLNHTMDLSDLAHYYREHQRLMAHWRAVLPAGSILDVPYAELVADQEGWTRRILDFIGLEWDERCLDFQNTQRAVVTASTWQVRQKIYKDSVARWRRYEKFIKPLLELRDLPR